MGKKNEKICVCIYEFMKNLGLRGTALAIYAFLYSYRKSEAGFFYGKRQLIADKCGISLRSVERGISKLLSMGFIVRRESGKYKGLAVSEEYVPCEKSKRNEEESRDKTKEKRESYMHDIYDELPCYRTDIKPKYEMILPGRGYFSLTVEQFEALLKLIPEEELSSYTARMERMLENNMASGMKPPKNYYRTLKKWITEDCKL